MIKASAFLTFTLLSIMGAPSVFAAEVNAADAPLPKVYVHRTYEHADSAKPDNSYAPNLGRVGEMKIDEADRALLSRYVQTQYKRTCAWEHNHPYTRCVVPHYHDKNYIIGYALASDKTYTAIPQKLLNRLRPLPYGYQYVLVGDDVLLMNASNRDVIDAVTLLSTYGPQ